MKKIDFKHPRYVLPLICLPFVLLLFYVYRLSSVEREKSPISPPELKSEISPASSQVRDKGIEDKLEAFKQRYKKSDGYSALGALEMPMESTQEISSAYNAKEKRMLDSISDALKSAGNISRKKSLKQSDLNSREADKEQDKEVAALLSRYTLENKKQPAKPSDPMAIFRAQMAIVDSMNKAAISPQQPSTKSLLAQKTAEGQKQIIPPALKVTTGNYLTPDSSTIVAGRESKAFIQGMIEQTLTGYSGSRVSIRLLSEIKVGGNTIKKGSLLYALISGFSAQRVLLSISSIALNGEILPVNLEVYDLDGLKGIYVPASLYQQFSRELSANAITGLSIESAAEQNQQLMSLLGRMFQSTQGALNKLIRSNKAKINYPSKVYLLDKSINQIKPSL